MSQEKTKASVSLSPKMKKEGTEEHQVLTLSNPAFDEFIKAIESKDEPNEALKQAANRYRQRFSKLVANSKTHDDPS